MSLQRGAVWKEKFTVFNKKQGFVQIVIRRSDMTFSIFECESADSDMPEICIIKCDRFIVFLDQLSIISLQRNGTEFDRSIDNISPRRKVQRFWSIGISAGFDGMIRRFPDGSGIVISAIAESTEVFDIDFPEFTLES